ncbi:MAG: HEAT repeat domain-containing protein [Verrucomicrobiales bacterium]|nr:HEAT repeat domain-containing protein [Verrucomicrobiales bacterium]
MLRTLFYTLSAVLGVTAIPAAISGERIEVHSEWCACKRHVTLMEATEVTSKTRTYARDREIDVKHLRLDLTPDFEKRTLAGIATLTFAPIANPLRTLKLDAVGLNILALESSVPVETWDVGKEAITISFAAAIAAGSEAWVKVTYRAEPKMGWYYRTEAMGYPKGDDHFWTQGEPEEHRNWFPGYDFPNERFTSEVICRVPKGMTVVSNGRLLEERQEGNLSLFHWSQEQEHVNYLISVIGGYFNKLVSTHGDLPLAFLTPPSEFPEAANSFRDTAAILAFLEEEIGVQYPWAKYYNVCVADFVAGGMENTSVTTLTTNTLFSADSENLRTSHRLDAHEITHQWFGDLVTCKDWSHLWLNEGFATYYTHLYDEHKLGTDQMRFRLYLDALDIIKNTDEKPVVWRGFKSPKEQFDYRSYPKGAWVLHMLRSQLGSDLYRKCIRTYLERHRNGNVVTDDLVSVLEEVSGKSWDQFFDQWIYHGGEPILKVEYSWDQDRKQAKLSIKQTQKISDQVLLFDFPLPVRFVDSKEGVHDFQVRIHEAAADFYFTLPEAPKIVRIDPEVTVLAGIEFSLPDAMLHAQLVYANDMMGRLIAANTLGGRTDKRSVELLGTVIAEDPYYAVRTEAAIALGKTHTPEALATLISVRKQDDARVRQEVVYAIASVYSESAFSALREVIAEEKNPDILTVALFGLGKFPQTEARGMLLAALNQPSYRHRISATAIEALQTRGDTSVVEPLLDYLEKNVSRFTTDDFGSGLKALASLSRDRDADLREEVRLFLAHYLTDPREKIRLSAIAALGSLRDLKSLGALNTYVDSGNSESPEFKAAEEAIKIIHGEKKQTEELTDLREELLKLKNKIETMDEELDTLKKQTTPETAEEKK